MVLRIVAVPLLIGFAGCKPTISYFRAQPNVVCAGQAAQLHWAASAGGEIVDKQSGATVVKTSKAGSAAVLPASGSTYRLDAKSLFGTTSREVGVTVVSSVAPQEVGASVADSSARCEALTLTVVAEARSEYWDRHVFAGSVSALGDRPLHVEHRDVKVDVPAAGTTAAFKDTPVLGTWTISTPLRQGEQCGVRTPRNLAVRVFPTCSQ